MKTEEDVPSPPAPHSTARPARRRRDHGCRRECRCGGEAEEAISGDVTTLFGGASPSRTLSDDEAEEVIRNAVHDIHAEKG